MKETAEETFSEELGKAIVAFGEGFEDIKHGFWGTAGNFVSGLFSGRWEWDNNFDQAITDVNKVYKDVVTQRLIWSLPRSRPINERTRLNF